jgi:hypothetical protein
MRNHFLRAGRVANLPSDGGGSSIVTTDLEVHYDLGNTSCWTGNSSSNSADYTLNDLSGNGYNGTIESRVSGTNTDSSVNVSKDTSDGNSLEISYTTANFDDNGAKLVISSSPDTIGTGAGTVELWMKYKFTNVSTERYGFMLHWQNGPGFNFWIWGNTNNYNFSHYKPKHFGVAGVDPSNVPYPGNPPNSGWGDWVHLVWSRTSTSSNDTKIYVNNSLEHTYTSSDDITGSPKSINAPLGILPLNFKIGAYRYYVGTGLTSSQVTTNWNADKTRFGH